MNYLSCAIRIVHSNRFVFRIRRIARMTFAYNNRKISLWSHHFVSLNCSFDEQHDSHLHEIWIAQLIKSIISFRSFVRRKQMSLHLIASICDISHDHFCHCDDYISNDRNEHFDAYLRFHALFCTSSYRSCERFVLHCRFQRRLHFRFWRFSLSIWSHHFVSFLNYISFWYATRITFENVNRATNQNNVWSFQYLRIK